MVVAWAIIPVQMTKEAPWNHVTVWFSHDKTVSMRSGGGSEREVRARSDDGAMELDYWNSRMRPVCHGVTVWLYSMSD